MPPSLANRRISSSRASRSCRVSAPMISSRCTIPGALFFAAIERLLPLLSALLLCLDLFQDLRAEIGGEPVYLLPELLELRRSHRPGDLESHAVVEVRCRRQAHRPSPFERLSSI